MRRAPQHDAGEMLNNSRAAITIQLVAPTNASHGHDVSIYRKDFLENIINLKRKKMERKTKKSDVCSRYRCPRVLVFFQRAEGGENVTENLSLLSSSLSQVRLTDTIILQKKFKIKGEEVWRCQTNVTRTS